MAYLFGKTLHFRSASVVRVILTVGIFSCVRLIQAQNAVAGAMTGAVTDSSGALVSGATVTIIDVGTHDQRQVMTNGEGRYTAPLLKPAQYQVVASGNGLTSNRVDATVLVGRH